MRKLSIVFVGWLAISSVVYSQEGFTGPSGAPGGYTGPGSLAQLTPVTVSEAKKLRDKTPVALRGKIALVVKKEKYEFHDDTGTIIVEIDRKVWQGISADENTLLEIRGHIDRDTFGVKIDVKSVSTL